MCDDIINVVMSIAAPEHSKNWLPDKFSLGLDFPNVSFFLLVDIIWLPKLRMITTNLENAILVRASNCDMCPDNTFAKHF